MRSDEGGDISKSWATTMVSILSTILGIMMVVMALAFYIIYKLWKRNKSNEYDEADDTFTTVATSKNTSAVMANKKNGNTSIIEMQKNQGPIEPEVESGENFTKSMKV